MYWVKKIIAGRFVYYLHSVYQTYVPKSFVPKWTGLQDNAKSYTEEQALNILKKLVDNFPKDEYTIGKTK